MITHFELRVRGEHLGRRGVVLVERAGRAAQQQRAQRGQRSATPRQVGRLGILHGQASSARSSLRKNGELSEL